MGRGGKHYLLGSAGPCLAQYSCKVAAGEQLVTVYEW